MHAGGVEMVSDDRVKLYSADQMASMLGVTRGWIYTNKWQLPHFRIGKFLRFDVEKVMRALERCKDE